MPRPQAAPAVLRARRRRELRTTYRLRRAVALISVAAAAAVTIVLALGAGESAPVTTAAPAPALRLLPSGPPSPQVVAQIGSLHLQLPVSQAKVTAIGYRRGSDGSLSLDAVGKQANAGVLTRLFRKIVGGGSSKLRWYALAPGSPTSALDVGAAPGTDVYSPVDGTVVAMTQYLLDGRAYGVRLDVQPVNAPSIVVSLTQIRPDPALTVGAPVAASTSKLGSVLDLSGVQKQALARYTQDAGNHVTVEVHPAATLALH
jgi:murein DD-endopeptidase MepM/ murein hydrolase activator NlpD